MEANGHFAPDSALVELGFTTKHKWSVFMRELTTFETRETAGGFLPFLVAIVASVIGSYIYDPVGPKKEGGEKKAGECPVDL